MIKFDGLGHINIVVDSIESAKKFYVELLGAIPVQLFPNFKNIGFARSAGFMETPEEVDVSILFLQIPDTHLVLELMEYHSPVGKDVRSVVATNDLGGVRHIALKVKNIDEAFLHVKNQDGVTLISNHPNYKPFKIDAISPDKFTFFDQRLESDSSEKQKVCDCGNYTVLLFCR
jgi:maltose O-acetyltransferase